MSTKNKKQPFFWFMLEFQKRERLKGNNYKFTELADLCNNLWSEMSDEEKAPYKERAAHFRRTGQDPVTSNSRPGSAAGSEASAMSSVYSKNEAKLNDISELDETLSRIVDIIAERPAPELLTSNFMFASFNVMLVTQTGVHYPNELSFARFSLARGIEEPFHTFLHCGPVPTGYLRLAMEHEQSTHKIPRQGMPDAMAGSSNFRALLRTLMDTAKVYNIKVDVDGREVVPIFAKTDQVVQVRGCFRRLAELTADESLHDFVNNKLVVLDFARLNYVLCMNSGKFSPVRPFAVCEADLNYSHYDYVALCDFHHERQVIECALGVCMKTVYLFFDIICRAYDIPLTEYHTPEYNSKLVRPDNYEKWVDKSKLAAQRAKLEVKDSQDIVEGVEALNLSKCESRASSVDVYVRPPHAAGRGRGFPIRPQSHSTISVAEASDDEDAMIRHVYRLNAFVEK